jgi:hypothetical protein
MKKCNKCLINKSLENFSKCKSNSDSLQYQCKQCQALYTKINKNNVRDDQIPDNMVDKTYRICSLCKENKLLTEYFKNNRCKGGYYSNCKQCNNKRNRKFAQNNPDKMLIYWRKSLENVQRKIKSNISRRIRNSISSKKNSKTLDYIGCSIDDFKIWIEYQFEEDMSWENYGKLWNFDHVVPCCSFDLTSEENIKKCFIWENTRPLYVQENASKNGKIQEDIINTHKKLVECYKLNLSGTS